MKKVLILLSLLLIIFESKAQIPSGYYDGTEGLSGVTLKTELYGIISSHTVLSYNSLWSHFQNTDKKSNGKVWDMYSDTPGGVPPYEFTFGSDQCGNYTQEGDCYNREHSLPKSWFNDASPMYSDLFHLYPTDGFVNGKRSNYPFGEVGNATWTSLNGSKLGNSSYPGYTGVVFEPIDEYKGDFARTYFYMVTCYHNVVSNWNSPMLNGTAYPAFDDWAIEMLIEWHEADPVDNKEIARNDAVYDAQNNRNPFIDHPEFACAIWSCNDAIAPVFNSLFPYISNVTANSFDLVVSINEAGKVYYIVQESSLPAPTIEQVLAGNYIEIVQPLLAYPTTVSGLLPNTSYKAYLIAQDNATPPNVQTALTILQANTVTTVAGIVDSQKIRIWSGEAQSINIQAEAGISSITVTDMLGRVQIAQNENIAENETTIFGLSSGIFIVIVVDGQGNKSFAKILVQ